MRKLITLQDNKDILINQPIPTDSDSIKTFVVEGVPEIPEVVGKRGFYVWNNETSSLDVVYEDVPPTEVEALRIESAQANAELFEMMLMMMGVM